LAKTISAALEVQPANDRIAAIDEFYVVVPVVVSGGAGQHRLLTLCRPDRDRFVGRALNGDGPPAGLGVNPAPQNQLIPRLQGIGDPLELLVILHNRRLDFENGPEAAQGTTQAQQ
jgi:hypothetical protein